MAKTTSKFRVIKDSSIYNNTKCASYGDDVLMVDVGGGIYLGNETSTPDLIAISDKQLKTINGESISGNGNIAIDANIMAIDISGDIDNVEEITTTQSDWNETNQSSPAYIKNKPVIPSEITESTISGWGFTKNTGTYSKPSTGIPKSDLASTIQTSLDKADTALQSETYKGTITGVSANGTSVATSGVANIPAATTSKYGVTKLSSATNSTSTTLAATASAVKAAYDLANSYKGTVTSVKINGTSYSPVSGVVDLGTIESGGSSEGGGACPIISTTDSSISMQPNTYYKKTNVTNLTISLATPTNTSIVNKYIIEFDAFSNISLPTTIAWANNETPTFKIGATYIIYIVNDLAMVTEFQRVVNFTFDDTTYQGLGGMTLEEWCNSDYNPGHYSIGGANVVNNNIGAAFEFAANDPIYSGANYECDAPL